MDTSQVGGTNMGRMRGTPPTRHDVRRQGEREASVVVRVLSDTMRVPSDMEPSTPCGEQQKHTCSRELRAS